jgi:hypothetical protein
MTASYQQKMFSASRQAVAGLALAIVVCVTFKCIGAINAKPFP